jgi:hypothetical protein
MKFMARVKSRTPKNFTPPLYYLVGSGIRDGRKSESGIRNKHLGSAILGLGHHTETQFANVLKAK